MCPHREVQDTLDTAPLQDAYRALLDAAATVADADDSSPAPPAGEWNADQILAHVALVTAATIAAVSGIAAGANTTYDNRIALDAWTIDRIHRVRRRQRRAPGPHPPPGDPLCAHLAGAALSDAELDIRVPTRLLSNDTAPGRSAHAAARHRHRSDGGRTTRPHETAPRPSLRPGRGRGHAVTRSQRS